MHKFDHGGIFTVGRFDSSGSWVTESEWKTAEEAEERVHTLNSEAHPHPTLNDK